MYLVLLTFTAILLALNQFASLLTSIFTSLISVLISWLDFKPAESSANSKVNRLVTRCKSLMKHKNNIGPKILPCSTEILIDFSLDKWPFMSTFCDLPSR